MSDNVAQLGIVKAPSADEVSKADCVAFLREALAQAEQGDVVELCLILKHPSGGYSTLSTPTDSHTDWIGMLESLKFGLQVLHAQIEGTLPDGWAR